MKFTSEHNGKKLTFSTWRDQGKTGVFASLTDGRDSRGVSENIRILRMLAERDIIRVDVFSPELAAG